MGYQDILANYSPLSVRTEQAKEKVAEIRRKFEAEELFQHRPITVYCAGSLGRGDIGKLSDLDLFILSGEDKDTISRLNEVEILSAAIRINRELDYKEFSNDGQFLKVYYKHALLDAVGDPKDDSQNSFTARMLMLLESTPVCNRLIYEEYLDTFIEHYFRDSRGKRSFRPLFLINDILRYWRTLCLNYELIRDDRTKPWRKKNINLKFSRMLTVFGTILPIVAKPVSTAECVKELSGMSPHQRLAFGLDHLADDTLTDEYQQLLESYEMFITWKEDLGSQINLEDDALDKRSREIARDFSDFIYKALSHQNIDSELKKYLVI